MVKITNIGNTCYINSILQIMFHTEFLNFKNLNSKENTKLFSKLIEVAKKSNELEVFNPIQLLNYFRWNDTFKFGMPHDAHEAFLHLLSIIECNEFEGKMIDIMYTPSKPIEQFVKRNITGSKKKLA